MIKIAIRHVQPSEDTPPPVLLESARYQGFAAEVFRHVSDELARAIPGARIEHIGSSAVSGAISKGDLDVCVIVAVGKLPETLATLKTLGYTEKMDTLRTPQLCMLVSSRRDIDLALQVIEAGSEFEFFLHFRDALRVDPTLAEMYNQVKLDSAHLGEDGYRDAKSRFIEQVLQGLQRPRLGTDRGA